MERGDTDGDDDGPPNNFARGASGAHGRHHNHHRHHHRHHRRKVKAKRYLRKKGWSFFVRFCKWILPTLGALKQLFVICDL
jgi:hypothetical protein